MDHTQLRQLLSDLIRIDSVNSAYDVRSSEAEIQRHISAFFQRHGIETSTQEVLPGRANVIARLAGRNSGRRIVFEAHCDTAGVDGMKIAPFAAQLSDGRIYGRGACDTKAGLAAMMLALVDLKCSKLPPPCEVWVVSAVDEEHAFAGARELCKNLQASAAVVSEPTGLRLAVASKGCLRWRITVTGKTAHSSMPALGTNAIEQMASVIRVLEDHKRQLQTVQHPLLGSPTLNVGLIQGGSQINNVPDVCWIEIDRRLLPGEEPAQVLSSYGDLLSELQTSCPTLKWSMDPLLQDRAMETPAESGIVKAAEQVLQAAGLNGDPIGVPFGSDASKFAMAGIPSVILGPGHIAQAHTPDEYVEVEQVERAFDVYRQIMKSFE